MRFLMLSSSLKLVGSSHLDPIFVSFCGLIQACIVVFKAMKGKKKYYKLTVEDAEVDEENKQFVVIAKQDI